MVGEDHLVPCRSREGLLYPRLHAGDTLWVVGGSRSDKVDVVMRQQILIALGEIGLRFAIVVLQRVGTNVYDAALAPVLHVVNLTDDRNDIADDDSLCEPVLAVEMYGVGIVGAKEVEGVHRRVIVAEESPHTLAVIVGHAFKAVGGHLAVFLHHGLGHDKLLYAVLAGIEESLFARHAMLGHSVAHLKCRIGEDAVIAA